MGLLMARRPEQAGVRHSPVDGHHAEHRRHLRLAAGVGTELLEIPDKTAG